MRDHAWIGAASLAGLSVATDTSPVSRRRLRATTDEPGQDRRSMPTRPKHLPFIPALLLAPPLLMGSSLRLGVGYTWR